MRGRRTPTCYAVSKVVERSLCAASQLFNAAGLNTITPGMLIIPIAGVSALFEPSTAWSATTGFARVVESAALVAYVADGSSCGNWALIHMRSTANC